MKLEVKQVRTRGNKFGIVAGRAILARFKTVELANEALEKHRSHWEYWAGSCSVSVQNAEPITVQC